ncbi:MAG: metal-sensing transcriptional repressor [Treponema sp.]|nr:metal-sensing transcriptional repressor [Treponema sp.]
MAKDCCHEEIGEEITGECPYCSGKHKEREDSEKKDLMNRLKRIEGQVRGVEGMLESGAYCTDILMQVCAITSALNSFNKVLLGNHVKTCVAENIRSGNDEVIDELVTTLQKLMK